MCIPGVQTPKQLGHQPASQYNPTWNKFKHLKCSANRNNITKLTAPAGIQESSKFVLFSSGWWEGIFVGLDVVMKTEVHKCQGRQIRVGMEENPIINHVTEVFNGIECRIYMLLGWMEVVGSKEGCDRS